MTKWHGGGKKKGPINKRTSGKSHFGKSHFSQQDFFAAPALKKKMGCKAIATRM